MLMFGQTIPLNSHQNKTEFDVGELFFLSTVYVSLELTLWNGNCEPLVSDLMLLPSRVEAVIVTILKLNVQQAHGVHVFKYFWPCSVYPEDLC